ncbi:helix-turn-helix domain-containing protein [Streptomyces sp. NPDC004610]|uniref:helix-turn-helix domain-containing protein n=1 Tax=unclassified Streptomyces TaxID=2593676 RepID=UPI0033B62BE7
MSRPIQEGPLSPAPPIPQPLPVPPTPPTPPVPLSALLAREDLALRQIAGPDASGVIIHGALTTEMSDPYPYLLGGELLLTAGVHITEAAGSGTYFDDYVGRVAAAGGAAVGFGVAPVHDTVPRALVAACESRGLPLLEVPPATTFAAVARAVWELMAQVRHAELRRVTEAQRSLAAAAARPDPVPSVLRRLSQRVGGGRAVLYGPRGDEIAGAGPRPDGPVDEALSRLTRLVTSRSSTTATDTLDGVHLTAYALGAGQGFALGLAAPRRDPADHTIASLAAVLLSLLTGEHQSGTAATRSSALVRLLLGAPTAEVAPLLTDGTGIGASTGTNTDAGSGSGSGAPLWRVVHARPTARPADPLAASGLGAALGSALVDLDEDEGTVRVLLPPGRDALPQPGWTLGVSAPAAPADWPSADTRAARALARARATRAPLVRHGARSALAELIPEDEATAHARALLAPLADSAALTDTLRTWLSLHGSWDRTAVALSVHRNTVRQRVARCAALLGTDLDDPDVRMELWFALRRV